MVAKFELKETKWVIMDKQRTVIAKGTPRNRHLISLDNKKDKKRVLYYNSKGMARNGYSTGFYSYGLPKEWDEYKLEPVEVELTMTEK
jgi:hypothetical protein